MDDQDEIRELEERAVRMLERQVKYNETRQLEEYVAERYKDALLFIEVLRQMKQEGM